MSEEKIVERANHDLPYGRSLNIKDLSFESGMEILRLTIREGKRFTIVDLDKESAEKICNDISNWIDEKTR